MMEVLVAVFMFGLVGTALVVALNDLGKLSFELHQSQRISRILDNELRRAISIPNIQEGTFTRSIEEFQLDLETVISPIEDLESAEGRPLSNMFRIQVTGFWFAEGQQNSETVETWRYARLYQR